MHHLSIWRSPCVYWLIISPSLGHLLDNVVPRWPIMATVTWAQHNDPPHYRNYDKLVGPGTKGGATTEGREDNCNLFFLDVETGKKYGRKPNTACDLPFRLLCSWGFRRPWPSTSAAFWKRKLQRCLGAIERTGARKCQVQSSPRLPLLLSSARLLSSLLRCRGYLQCRLRWPGWRRGWRQSSYCEYVNRIWIWDDSTIT